MVWLARQMPLSATPNFMTGVGFAGACIVAAGYILSRWQPAYLWLANLGLVINWLGDSLDGNIARTAGGLGSIVGAILGIPFIDDVLKLIWSRLVKKV